jgi:hypothetical protein
VKEESCTFLKKRTKKLLPIGLSLSGMGSAKQIKVFCFFFSKKKALPLFDWPELTALHLKRR